MSLFAICHDNGAVVVKRIPLNQNVQHAIRQMFQTQERDFLHGVTTEVAYSGNYKPDDDEVLTVDVTPEATQIRTIVAGNAAAVPRIDIANFEGENIKALAGARGAGANQRILLQKFMPRQNLRRGFALVHAQNAFRELQEPAFSLNTALTAIIQDGVIKFRSDFELRTIIPLLDVYRAATEQETRNFAANALFDIADEDAFVEMTNQVSRKLITSVVSSGVLQNKTAGQIAAAARRTGLNVTVRNNRVVMPAIHRDAKALLKFLAEDRFNGPLTGNGYVSNSKRPA